MVIDGPSGIGKSTVASLLARYRSPRLCCYHGEGTDRHTTRQPGTFIHRRLSLPDIGLPGCDRSLPAP